MTDDFRAMINKYRARMAMLKSVMERDGCLQATSRRDPSYCIQLTRNVSSEAPWRVTSYRDRVPIGHREYDMLDGGGPTQNALGEFASDDMQLIPRARRADRSASVVAVPQP